MTDTRSLPARLHHTAFVTNDQEKTRQFYEDVLGLPLVATWCEQEELFGKLRTYCHTFFGLADGSALAFFQFADPEDQREFGPEIAKSPFHHTAFKVDQETQDRFKARLESAGYADQMYFLEHGYCSSLYVEDPNGMLVEFAVDHPEVERIDADQQVKAHDELKRWLAGDHTPNNDVRQYMKTSSS